MDKDERHERLYDAKYSISCTGSLVYLLSAYRKVIVSVFDISGCESTLTVLFTLREFYSLRQQYDLLQSLTKTHTHSISRTFMEKHTLVIASQFE